MINLIQRIKKHIYNKKYYSEIDINYDVRRPKLNAMAVDSLLCGDRDKWIGLDYGGGNGNAAIELRKIGYKDDSYDPYGKCLTKSENHRAYNFCSVFEVFEHACDPKEILDQIVRICNSDRLVILIGTHVNDNYCTDLNRTKWWYYAPRNGHISIHSKNRFQS